MKLTVLGRYGPWPARGGACSGYLLEAGKTRLLLDCGCGVLGRLPARCPIEKLNGVVLSHLHSDHMGDMMVLSYALSYYLEKGLIATKMPVFLPASPADAAETIMAEKGFDAKAVRGGDEIDFCGLRMRFFRVRHPVECNAVRIEHMGKSLVYSGDMNVTEGFEDFARGADLLLIDGCFLEKDWNEDSPHLSAALAAGIGQRAGAGSVLLTHIRPADDESALEREAQRRNPWADVVHEGTAYIF